MLGVTAEGYGWDFIWQNLQNYMGDSKTWYLFPLTLVLILFARKKKYRVLGIYPYLLFFVTVCNPYLITFMGNLIGLADRYYRFFWIIPLGLTLGVIVAWACLKIKRGVFKGMLCAVSAALIIILGSPAYLGQAAPKYSMTETKYYNSQSTIRISEELHKHGIQNPVVAYPDTLLYDLCQYDPYHISVLTRDETPRIMNSFSMETLHQAVTDKNYEMIVKYVFLSGWIDQLSADQLREAFTNYRVDYFVIPETQSQVLEYYEAAGCVVSGHTDGYYIVYTQLG